MLTVTVRTQNESKKVLDKTNVKKALVIDKSWRKNYNCNIHNGAKLV